MTASVGASPVGLASDNAATTPETAEMTSTLIRSSRVTVLRLPLPPLIPCWLSLSGGPHPLDRGTEPVGECDRRDIGEELHQPMVVGLTVGHVSGPNGRVLALHGVTDEGLDAGDD